MVQVWRPQQQASKQLVIVLAHFGRFANGALAVAEEVQRLEAEGKSVCPRNEVIFSMTLRRGLR